MLGVGVRVEGRSGLCGLRLSQAVGTSWVFSLHWGDWVPDGDRGMSPEVPGLSLSDLALPADADPHCSVKKPTSDLRLRPVTSPAPDSLSLQGATEGSAIKFL